MLAELEVMMGQQHITVDAMQEVMHVVNSMCAQGTIRSSSILISVWQQANSFICTSRAHHAGMHNMYMWYARLSAAGQL